MTKPAPIFTQDSSTLSPIPLDNAPPDDAAYLAMMDEKLEHVKQLLDHDTPHALELVDEIIHQTEHTLEPEFTRRRAFALQMRSRLVYRQMKYAEAIRYGAESLYLYESLDDVAGQYNTSFVLGIYHIALADTTQAMAYLNKAIEYAEKIQDYWGIGSASGAMGVLHINNGHYLRASEILDYALTMQVRVNDLYGQAVVISNQARAYAHLGDFHKAIDLAHHAINLSYKVNSDYLRVRSELTLADVYTQAGQAAQALDQFETCLATCRKKGWLELEITTVSKVGKAYLGIGEVQRAVDVLELGCITAHQTSSTYAETDILKVLVEAYEQQGDYLKAYERLKRLHALQRQQLDEERSTRLQAIEQGYHMRLARHEAETQRKRVEEIEKRAATDRLYFQQLNQIRDEFLSAATHDLKNPLASVRVNTYMLRRKLGERTALLSHLDLIDSHVERMVEMITDMLELAKLETGRALDTRLTSLHTVLQETVQEYQPRAEAKSLKLTYYSFVNAANAITKLDERLIRRAISNLLSNAVKYSRIHGEITVQLRQEGAYLVVTLGDQGIGIAPHDVSRIFERFYRVRQAETQEIEGSGLGLSIVKAVIDQHRGMITVESMVNVGTTFQILLPIVHE